MRVDEDDVVVRWPQTVQPLFLYRNKSRVESKTKTWPWIVTLISDATISVGSRGCRRIYDTYEHGEGGPPAAEAWEMIFAEAGKASPKLDPRQGKTQTGSLLKYTPIPFLGKGMVATIPRNRRSLHGALLATYILLHFTALKVFSL